MNNTMTLSLVLLSAMIFTQCRGQQQDGIESEKMTSKSTEYNFNHGISLESNLLKHLNSNSEDQALYEAKSFIENDALEGSKLITTNSTNRPVFIQYLGNTSDAYYAIIYDQTKLLSMDLAEFGVETWLVGSDSENMDGGNIKYLAENEVSWKTDLSLKIPLTFNDFIQNPDTGIHSFAVLIDAEGKSISTWISPNMLKPAEPQEVKRRLFEYLFDMRDGSPFRPYNSLTDFENFVIDKKKGLNEPIPVSTLIIRPMACINVDVATLLCTGAKTNLIHIVDGRALMMKFQIWWYEPRIQMDDERRLHVLTAKAI